MEIKKEVIRDNPNLNANSNFDLKKAFGFKEEDPYLRQTRFM